MLKAAKNPDQIQEAAPVKMPYEGYKSKEFQVGDDAKLSDQLIDIGLADQKQEESK